MDGFYIVEWLTELFSLPGPVFHEPLSLDWLLQLLRAVAGAFFFWFVIQGALANLWKGRFHRFTMLCFVLYLCISVAVLALLCNATYYVVSSTTKKQQIIGEWFVARWVLEMLVWWSVASVAAAVSWYANGRAGAVQAALRPPNEKG